MITAPTDGSTVSDTVTITAAVSDAPVTGIQFLIDSSPVGSMDTIAPYQIDFDTKTLSYGFHDISAQGTDSNNVTVSAAPITVKVDNTPPPPPPPVNLILNPSFETGSGSTPDHWLTGGWGTNSASYTYPVAGQDGARAARTEITSYTSGDAKWYNEPVAVTPGKQYDISDYYRSNTTSEIDIEYTLDGRQQFIRLADGPAGSS